MRSPRHAFDLNVTGRNIRLVSNFELSCGSTEPRYRIQIPLPPKIDPSVTMMTVEDAVQGWAKHVWTIGVKTV